MTVPSADLKQQAEEFGQEMAGLLSATLPSLPDQPIDILQRGNRFIIRPTDGTLLPLHIDGQVLASLKLSVACELDSASRYLAVSESTFSLLATLDRTPIIRVHYYREPQTVPGAHVHVHGHRGALSHLLSQCGHAKPHEMASLHIPVGGSRFRPCLEDFIQFLICECGFEHHADWKRHVEAGRERWRRRQAATVVRDVPDEAVRALRDLGYTVQPPDPEPMPSLKALRSW